MSAQLLELRQVLAQRFPDAVPVAYRTTPAVATGIEVLDEVLPGGGLPRGRLTAWVPGGGATALLRSACEAVVGRGERAAWVDGVGLVAGDGWRAGPVLIRPRGRTEALACAEELVRSGGFALVVVTGGGAEPGMGVRRRRASRAGSPGPDDGEAVRLSRGAREGGAALVVLVDRLPMAALRLVSRIPPDGYRWRPGPLGEPAEVRAVRARVRARGMGWSRETEVLLTVADHDVRLSLDPERIDRRGVRA